MFRLVIIALMINMLFQADFTLLKEYEVDSGFLTTDQFANVYVFKGSTLTKYDEQNDKIIYDNKLFGNIYSVDVSDPFRILIFNKDFNKITFLDKNLTEILSPVDLNDLEYFNVGAVCQSNNGGFWIFDQDLYQPIFFDKNLKLQKKGSQVRSILIKTDDQNPVFMLEKNDYIYVGIKEEGILLFDNYGTYIKTFPLDVSETFQVIDETILFEKDGYLVFYSIQNFEKETLDLPKDNIRNARMEGNSLFVQTASKVFVFQVNNIK